VKRGVVAWALYDWANSAYSTTVISGFFPVFLKSYWATGLDPTESSFALGVTSSISSLALALLAPFVGALCDAWDWHRRAMIVFLAAGLACTLGLSFAAQGQWKIALVLYAIGTLGWSGANAIYDALLTAVTSSDRLDRVSALGFSLGYLGGGLLFSFCVALTLHPELVGLPDKSAAVRLSFALVALWWGIFSIPLLLNFPKTRKQRAVSASEGEDPPHFRPLLDSLKVFRQLYATLRNILKLDQVALFLLAYWLYIDGVDTVIRMAVDYGLAIGLPDKSLILALLITQFVGFPAALLFGVVGQRLGPKTGVLIAIAVYLGVCLYGYGLSTATEFYLLAVTVGLVQGGIQSLSRSLFARLIPEAQSAEFFGFYNMVGKYAAILGPTLMGGVSALTGNPRAGILSLSLLLLAGGALLTRVRVPPSNASTSQ